MRNKFFKILFLLMFTVILSGCAYLLSSAMGETEVRPKGSIPREYWGTWIRMDTGEEYTITDKTVTSRYTSTKGLGDITKESNDVLVYGKEKNAPRLFRKGGSNRNFTAQLVGFEHMMGNIDGPRSAGAGIQNIKGRRQNKTNSEDKQSVSSDENGRLNFTDAVAGDTQEIVVENPNGEKIVLDVVPQYSGENIGTIPLITKDHFALKTTYSIDTELEDYMYGNNAGYYDISIKIENISNTTCKTSYYTISWDDVNFNLYEIEKEGNIRTLEKGDNKTFKGRVSYGTLDEEYKDVVVNIKIEDVYNAATWNDSITLRFYRERIPLYVNAKFVDGYSGSLKGFVIYPDGRSKWFEVPADTTRTIMVPYSKKDYILVFSGATKISEMKYSFNFNNSTGLCDLSGPAKPVDILFGESPKRNDKMEDAYFIADSSESNVAVLTDDDLDYFRINNSDKINVSALNFSRIEIAELPEKTGYYYGDSLTTNGIVVNGITENNEVINLTRYVTYSGFNSYTYEKTSQTITVSYNNHGTILTDTFIVTMNQKVLERLRIDSRPDKKDYYVNQKLNTNGLIVTAVYNDGSTKDVSNQISTSYDMSLPSSMSEVTLSYTDEGITKTATFYISVYDIPLASEDIVINNITYANTSMVNLYDEDKDSFYQVGKYEVTEELYNAVMNIESDAEDQDKYPARGMTWNQAVEFCEKLNKKLGYNSNYGYRLPTRLEWVEAAKGDQNYSYAGSATLDEVAWYKDNSGGKVHQVGLKKPNGYDLYDMTGNVNEWTSDIYGYGHYFCGGGYESWGNYLLIENFNNTSGTYATLGFRLFRTIPKDY